MRAWREAPAGSAAARGLGFGILGRISGLVGFLGPLVVAAQRAAETADSLAQTPGQLRDPAGPEQQDENQTKSL